MIRDDSVLDPLPPPSSSSSPSATKSSSSSSSRTRATGGTGIVTGSASTSPVGPSSSARHPDEANWRAIVVAAIALSSIVVIVASMLTLYKICLKRSANHRSSEAPRGTHPIPSTVTPFLVQAHDVINGPAFNKIRLPTRDVTGPHHTDYSDKYNVVERSLYSTQY